MRIKITTKGSFDNISGFLKRNKMSQYIAILNKYGKIGVQQLRENTPIDTSETANSWDYKIERKGKSAELYFINTAHPESPVSVAMLLEYGHGTRTGGYVQPRKFISPVSNKIMKDISIAIGTEVRKL